ncbi:MAG TPA: DUF6519 domain-containing protein [Alloacidobacterium sp.]|nr:DUF6519 domain-containing protein [Alloacidobacterium sp.]
MKGDFSRFTFEPRKHYSGVLHQQGRVWLDSDWNEEVMERLALLQQELQDVVGPSGVPAPGSSFQLTASKNSNALDDFGISAGHCYVNGILCQLDADTTYLSQPDLLDPPRIPIPTDGSTLNALVYLEVWQRLITYLEDDSIREIALGGPDTSARLKNIVQVKVRLLPADVGTLTCAQGAQFVPKSGSGTLTTLQPTNVQQQSLCQLPDATTFTGRENHLYRVQVHDGGDVPGNNLGAAFTSTLGSSVSAGATSLTVSTALTSAQADAAQRAGYVTVSDNSGVSERVPLAIAGVSSDGLTLTLAQGLKNAYTTANSASVTGGVAHFKWSRDNAAFAVNVTSVQSDGVTLTLSGLGRDVATTLRAGDLIEITDDASELGPASGHLTTLAQDPDPDTFTAVLTDPIPASFQLPGAVSSPPSPTVDRHMVLRRWDGIGDAASVYGDAGTPGMNLGDGVHIQFGGSDLRAGDYWQFTARSADGSIQPLLDAPPAGINRSRTPLALVNWGPPPLTSPPAPSGSVSMNVTSCLPMFPALINFPPIDQGFHVVGLSTVDFQNNVTQLFNDSNVQVNSFAGINVQCDANVDPASVARPTCFVTVEYPIVSGDSSGSGAYFPVVLGGSVSCKDSVISWTAGSQAQTLLTQLLSAALNERGLLMRLVVKGDFIWSQDDPNLFLDGEAFGQPPQGGNSNISLRLPSGDRRRGGNFDMWFWIVAAPSFITAIQANPPGPINIGDTTTITMTLSSQAPANSTITLTLDSANVSITGEVVGSPPTFTVTVPVQAGATTATVTATGAAVGSTTISASFGGQTVALSLIVQPVPVLTGQLVLNPGSVFVGGASTGTVTISGPAPQSGLVVSLATSNPNVAQLSSGSITVPAGGTTATFTVSGSAAGSATISATAGVTLSALFTVVQRKGKEFEKVHADKIAEKSISIETLPKVKLSDRVLSGSASATTVRASSVEDSISSAKGAAFIRLEERPLVGEAVLSPPVKDDQQNLEMAGSQVIADQASISQKAPEKPPSAEKGIMAERLGDRPIQ